MVVSEHQVMSINTSKPNFIKGVGAMEQGALAPKNSNNQVS